MHTLNLYIDRPGDLVTQLHLCMFWYLCNVHCLRKFLTPILITLIQMHHTEIPEVIGSNVPWLIAREIVYELKKSQKEHFSYFEKYMVRPRQLSECVVHSPLACLCHTRRHLE